MARWVPFTLHIRIVPDSGSGLSKGKRFEYVRDMQKIAHLMYESLSNISGIQIAQPGGGQQASYYGGDHNNSGLISGMAVKPQFGETPAQVMITGFVEDSGAANVQHYVEIQRISGNETYTGFAPSHATNNPTSHLDTLVSTFKTDVETALAGDIPAGIIYNVFRIDMAGVIYGDRGYHFP